jgi:ATP synthase protein I
MAQKTPQFPTQNGGSADADRQARAGWKYAGIGLQFAGSILLFLYVGRWVDDRFGSEPWGLVVGVFVGAGASFYSMYRRLMADLAREEARAKVGRP